MIRHLLLCLIPALALADPLELRTSGGFILALRPDGGMAALQSGAGDLLTPGTSSGIWVEDVKTGEAEQFLGHVEHGARGLIFSGRAKRLGLAVSAEFIAEKGAVRVAGHIENLAAGERAVDVQFRIYCQAQGTQWARDVQVSGVVGSEAPPPRSIYPFHSLVLPRGKGALALAVSAAEPAMFEFAYEKNSYYVLKLKYGLSQYAGGRLHKRANFETLLYSIDPKWGFRSATEGYYRLHERWFRRRANRDGMWLHNYHAEKIPNPWDYAYRVEVNGPRGMGWEYDARQGIPTIEYLITGMRELRRLPKVPERYEDQMREVQNTRQVYTHNIAPQSIYRREKLEREVILNSGLFDENDHYRILPRTTDWGGASLTFPLNTSPNLYADRPVPTVGKITMEWVRWLFREYPLLKGVFVDSLHGWGRYFNCRAEHFPYARISLTYDPVSKRPAISNMFANQEFLYALGDVLHPEGRLVMGNGPRPGRFFNGMALDILGTESPIMPQLEEAIMGGAAPGGGGRVPVGLIDDQYSNPLYYRTVAGQKPHMLMNYDKKEWLDISMVERFWRVGLHFGVYPGYRQVFAGEAWQHDEQQWKAVQKILNVYSPLLKQVTAAGWQPVTHAATGNPKVWIERYGDTPSAMFFTLMNTDNAKQTATVTLEREPLRLGERVGCVELVRPENQPSVTAQGIVCPLEAKEVRLIRIVQ